MEGIRMKLLKGLAVLSFVIVMIYSIFELFIFTLLGMWLWVVAMGIVALLAAAIAIYLIGEV